MSHEMEVEDYLQQCRAEVSAQREQIDNLVAMVANKDRQIAELTEQRNRMTVALDDALGIIRSRNARDEAMRAEAEALEL
jgi:predicted RNase H-like nuclease (RuvC/YqgF family)